MSVNVDNPRAVDHDGDGVSLFDGDCDDMGRLVESSQTGVALVMICAQRVDVGCTEGQTAATCGDDTKPSMRVTLTNDFYVSETEVNQRQFEAITGYNPSYFNNHGGGWPVEQVSWNEAASFANKLSAIEGFSQCYSCDGSGVDTRCEIVGSPYECGGYRLLTEVEWEAAARCGEDLPYAGSDLIDEVGWYRGNSVSTNAVKRKLENNCLLYDMTGNVSEWTNDVYGSSTYAEGSQTDPAGPDTGAYRVFRGGGWSDTEEIMISSRGIAPARGYGAALGFRIARMVNKN